ncbi:MAG: prolyl oligopeptidase family serine peptidase [Chitinophagaceae bacterium]
MIIFTIFPGIGKNIKKRSFQLNSYQLLLIITIIALSSCKKEIKIANDSSYVNLQSPVIPASQFNNIAYGNHPQQKLDLYLPEGRSKNATKLMILIHGGEWSGGDKSQMEYFIRRFQSDLKDFAFASLNYRLAFTNNNLFPSQEEDVNNAVLFLLNRLDSFHISDKHILFGESAGGHLALLQAFKYKRSSARAVVALAPPSDLLYMYNNPISPQNREVLERIIGGTPASTNLYQTSSPANYTSGYTPAMLLFHGTNDNVIDPRQSINLTNKLRLKGENPGLFLLQNELHRFSTLAFDEVFLKTIELLKQPQLFKN